MTLYSGHSDDFLLYKIITSCACCVCNWQRLVQLVIDSKNGIIGNDVRHWIVLVGWMRRRRRRPTSMTKKERDSHQAFHAEIPDVLMLMDRCQVESRRASLIIGHTRQVDGNLSAPFKMICTTAPLYQSTFNKNFINTKLN